jgi:hypothetical protein
MTIISNSKDIKTEIEKYANDSDLTELEIVEKLKEHYFDKINKNLKTYNKGREITKNLKSNHKNFMQF